MIFKKGIGLVAAGFALGTLGIKALTSNQAKKIYVQAVSKGLQAKAAGQDIIEQAKSNVDDIIAEANYLNEQEEQHTEVTRTSSTGDSGNTARAGRTSGQSGTKPRSRAATKKK
ncbi:MAG: DUF6110 family protein [Coriobacteriales bacterium]|jgi:polyhydroxyalkanoate synthesis regulator phasin|nr:DUF6110 family protein [Coriobacteriales bacterium]